MAKFDNYILNCGHARQYHKRGQSDCLYCAECDLGYMVCKHVDILLRNFFAQEQLPGTFIDRSFVQRLLSNPDIGRLAPGDARDRLEQAARAEAVNTDPPVLYQAVRCVEAMVAVRDAVKKDLEKAGGGKGPMTLPQNQEQSPQKRAEMERQLWLRDTMAGVQEHAESERRPKVLRDRLATSEPGSNHNASEVGVIADPAAARSRPTSHGQPAQKPPSPPGNVQSELLSTDSPIQNPTSTEVDGMPHANIQDLPTSPRLQQSRVAQLQKNPSASATPQKRKQSADMSPHKHASSMHRRSKSRSNAASVSPRIGRASLAGRNRRPPAALASGDEDSLVDSSDESLIDDSKGRVDRELKGISSAKLISLYTSLCRDHKKFAADNLRNICQENSFIAFWMVEQMKKQPSAKTAESRILHQLDGENDADSETAEDILARFRGPAERTTPRARATRLRQQNGSSRKAAEVIEDSQMDEGNDDPESPSPSGPAPTQTLPCTAYHDKFSPWPADATGACCYHPGKLVWKSVLRHPDSWTEVDPKMKMVRKNLKLTAWTCCEADGESTGCTPGFHPDPAEAAATSNQESSIAALAMRNIESAASNQQPATDQEREDAMALDGGTEAQHSDYAPSSAPSEPLMNTRDFLQQRMAQANATPKDPPAGKDTLDDKIWADFPEYARCESKDKRHLKARQIVADQHFRYPLPDGCKRCVRRQVVCYYSEERDKCALCCSRNQSKEYCAKDWARPEGELVPAKPELQAKVSRDGAMIAWKEKQGNSTG